MRIFELLLCVFFAFDIYFTMSGSRTSPIDLSGADSPISWEQHKAMEDDLNRMRGEGVYDAKEGKEEKEGKVGDVVGEERAVHDRRVGRSAGPRGSRWAFTLHPSEGKNVMDCWDDLREIGRVMEAYDGSADLHPIRFLCAQIEEGKRPHIQGYVEFRSRKTLSAAKSIMHSTTIHMELAQGTPEQNVCHVMLRVFAYSCTFCAFPEHMWANRCKYISESFFDMFEHIVHSDDIQTEVESD